MSFWHAQSFIKGAALKRAEIINARGFLAELTAAKSCELRTTPLPSLWSGQRRFSSPRSSSHAFACQRFACRKTPDAHGGSSSSQKIFACANLFREPCKIGHTYCIIARLHLSCKSFTANRVRRLVEAGFAQSRPLAGGNNAPPPLLFPKSSSILFGSPVRLCDFACAFIYKNLLRVPK